MSNEKKQWPQNYYKHVSSVKMSLTDSAQSFYNKGVTDDCLKCYYKKVEKKDDEFNYPQSFYNNSSTK